MGWVEVGEVTQQEMVGLDVVPELLDCKLAEPWPVQLIDLVGQENLSYRSDLYFTSAADDELFIRPVIAFKDGF